ncbi:MAG: S9 family peptidase [Planctomycetaceae bacterium]|nr:S9 family peptidase [Planctomycetaceae bacterium]
MDLASLFCLALASVQSQDASKSAPEARALIPREVLFGNPERAGVKISPDGKYLSYVAPLDGVLNVWVMPVDGGDARPLTDSVDRPIGSYSWAENSEQILYSQDKGGNENTHVYVVSLDGGQALDLTPGDDVKASISSSSRDRPDEILVSSNARQSEVSDLLLVNTRTGESSMHFENDGGYVSMISDPDWNVRVRGRMTADGGSSYDYRDSEAADWMPFETIGSEDSMTTQPLGFNRDGSRFWMIDSRGRDTAALVSMSPGSGGMSDSQIVFESPVSDVADSITNPETYEPQALATNRLRREWHILDDSIRPDLDALARLSDGELEIVSRTRDDKTWVVAFMHDNGPVRYWVWDRDEQSGRFLFSHRPELEDVSLSSMTGVEIPTRDGLSMPSYLTVPHFSNGKKLPMVLLVHGGPWARDSWGYNPYHQWLSDRGYAVLSVNFRGSTGFGKEFLNAGNREWYGKMQDDLVDAVDWAVKEGVADPDRVAIMGGSYGGYATLAALTRDPELFACGVDIVGPSHVRTLLDTIPAYWEPIKVMFETRVCPFDDDAYQDAISPLTHVANISRPLLIGQGANDPRVKLSESDQIVAAMDENGIAVTYVVFPDEGHGFRRPENNKAFNAITEAFLAEHIGGRAEPVAGDLEVSTAQMRRLGGLSIPGATQWVEPVAGAEPSLKDAAEAVAYEDLSPQEQKKINDMLTQLDNVMSQMKQQQAEGDFDEAAIYQMMLENIERGASQVPAEERPAFLCFVEIIKARAKALQAP